MNQLPASHDPTPETFTFHWRAMLRSTLAVITGYIHITVFVRLLWLGLGYLMPALHEETAGRSLLAYFLDAGVAAVASLAAGYITALIARRDEARHAFILVIALVLLSAINYLFPAQGYAQSGWHSLMQVIIMVLLVPMGARLRREQRLRKEGKEKAAPLSGSTSETEAGA